MLIGYARVSTDEQHPQAQLDALTRAGVEEANLYVDHTSGAKSSRPQWDVVQRVVRAGDTLICTRLDRVGRSTAQLVSLLDEFRQRGVAFTFLEQGVDTTTAEGRMVYRMLAAVAEFQRDLIVSNTREGLAAARARGRTGGRKPKLSATQARDAQEKYDSRNWTVQQIAELYRVPRTTLYNHLATGTTTVAAERVEAPQEPLRSTAVQSRTPAPLPSPEKAPAQSVPDEQSDEQALALEQTPPPPSTPATTSGRRRRRKRYSIDEINAYQLEPQRGESGQILSYRVVVAGDTLGHIERAPYGHRGWLARDAHFTIQPHQRGTGRRYATNREQAVIDLLIGLGYTGRH